MADDSDPNPGVSNPGDFDPGEPVPAEPGDAGTVPGTRRCALSRVDRPPQDLIRFVAGPEDVIVPDLARRLPGRGLSLTADRQTVVAAMQRKVFARGLKRAVVVPAELADIIERLMTKRVLEALSLANKAGLVIGGFYQIDAAIEAGEVKVLLHGSDAAPGGRDKLDRKFIAIGAADGRQSPIFTDLTIAEISLAMGRANVVHTGIKPGGATDRYLSEALRRARYRSGFDASSDAPTSPATGAGTGAASP